MPWHTLGMAYPPFPLSVSKRVTITLSDGIKDLLDLWADAEGDKSARLASFIVETAVREAHEKGKIPEAPKGDDSADSK